MGRSRKADITRRNSQPRQARDQPFSLILILPGKPHKIKLLRYWVIIYGFPKDRSLPPGRDGMAGGELEPGRKKIHTIATGATNSSAVAFRQVPPLAGTLRFAAGCFRSPLRQVRISLKHFVQLGSSTKQFT